MIHCGMKREKEALPAFLFPFVALLLFNSGIHATPVTREHDDRTIE